MKIFGILLIFLLILYSCSKKEEPVILKIDTPAYDLAISLTKQLPSLSPDSNKILISTKNFDITTGEVLNTLQTNFADRVQQLKSMDAEQLKKIIEDNAEGIAQNKLLLLAADKSGVQVNATEIDSILNSYYSRSGGEKQYKKFLESRGFTLDFVRESTKTSLSIQRYFDVIVAQEIQVNEEELQQAYQKTQQGDKTATVRHILLETKGKNETEKQAIRRKMENILKRARSGEDFADLATKNTDDAGSKESGGLYEDFNRGDMVKPFEDAAFSVPVGEISDIVESQFGYHIIKVIERKRESQTLAELRSQLEKELRKGQEKPVIDAHIEKLKQDANMVKNVL
jgi:foldase protein PrsA